MSTVKYRTRTSQRKLTAYKKFELLTDEIIYPVINYDGYGDGVGTDLSAFVTDAMREDWWANRKELLRFWASGEYLRDKPWLFACGHGELPWAARVFDRKKQNQDA
jgi:hypothetical protein